jgi:hypothetical protein
MAPISSSPITHGGSVQTAASYPSNEESLAYHGPSALLVDSSMPPIMTSTETSGILQQQPLQESSFAQDVSVHDIGGDNGTNCSIIRQDFMELAKALNEHATPVKSKQQVDKVKEVSTAMSPMALMQAISNSSPLRSRSNAQPESPWLKKPKQMTTSPSPNKSMSTQQIDEGGHVYARMLVKLAAFRNQLKQFAEVSSSSTSETTSLVDATQ